MRKRSYHWVNKGFLPSQNPISAQTQKLAEQFTCLKATSQSTIFDILMLPLREDNTDIVLPVKEGPQLP